VGINSNFNRKENQVKRDKKMKDIVEIVFDISVS